MAFSFQTVQVGTKLADIRKTKKGVDFIIEDKANGDGDFYVFLLDCNPLQIEIDSLKSYINEFRIKNYCILNCVNKEYKKDELKGQTISSFMRNNSSEWEEFIKRKRQPIKAIMAFGYALYNINGNADIATEDFYADRFIKPYYYSGHQYRKLNTFIFPVDSVREVFPTNFDESFYDKNPAKLVDIGKVITCKTRFFKAQLKRMVANEYNESEVDLREPRLFVLRSKEQVDQVLNENMNSDLVAWDIETSGLKFYEDTIVCITICWNGVDGYYLPFKYVDKELFTKNILSCKRNTGANPKFDTKFLWHNGFPQSLLPTDAVDMIAHMIFSERPVGLKPLAFLYSSLGGYDNKLDEYKTKTKCSDYSKIPQDILSEYAIMDAIATWRIQKSLEAQMDYLDTKYENDKSPEWTTRRWYETQCMPIYQEAIRTEYNGIYINTDIMDANRDLLDKDVESKKAELRKIWNVDKSFNVFSTIELGKLFERLGFPCHGRTKEGIYATDEDAMEAWIREGMPGVELLKSLRNEKTALTSFLGREISDNIRKPETFTFGEIIDEEINDKQTGWLNYMHHVDEDDSERIFQSYRVMGTTSFRFIGKDPNFQNIPTRGIYAPLVKRCIDTPKDDLYIITGDSGKEYKLASFEYALTDRGYIQAKDLKESDKLIEDADSPVVLKLGIEVEEGKPTQFPEKFWFSDEE